MMAGHGSTHGVHSALEDMGARIARASASLAAKTPCNGMAALHHTGVTVPATEAERALAIQMGLAAAQD